MSQQLINRSADLKKLRDEGYDVEIRSGFLLVKDVPYVSKDQSIKRGALVTKLILAGDQTTQPDTHVAYFAGDYPCNKDGGPIEKIRNESREQTFADGVVIQHTFSANPQPSGSYKDYYDKVITYCAILSGPAQAIDPTVTAKMFPVIVSDQEEDTPFQYIDTASSRAEINLVTKKLALGKIAILGLGGTGSYVLDLVAKTPVKEIHPYDGDIFIQHNAFRSPGAPSIELLKAKLYKSTYFKNLYSNMHKGIIDHPTYINETNVVELQSMDFVFICLDKGSIKEMIVYNLEKFNISFIDVGIGVDMTDDSLGGILRITTSTPQQRDHFRKLVSFSDGDGDNEYNRNIQIADLNALNASLAVIKWKKLFGFYRDYKLEHHSTYTIDGNLLLSEEQNQ